MPVVWHSSISAHLLRARLNADKAPSRRQLPRDARGAIPARQARSVDSQQMANGTQTVLARDANALPRIRGTHARDTRGAIVVQNRLKRVTRSRPASSPHEGAKLHRQGWLLSRHQLFQDGTLLWPTSA